jgi:hypothetical protein
MKTKVNGYSFDVVRYDSYGKTFITGNLNLYYSIDPDGGCGFVLPEWYWKIIDNDYTYISTKGFNTPEDALTHFFKSGLRTTAQPVRNLVEGKGE